MSMEDIIYRYQKCAYGRNNQLLLCVTFFVFVNFLFKIKNENKKKKKKKKTYKKFTQLNKFKLLQTLFTNEFSTSLSIKGSFMTFIIYLFSFLHLLS